MYFSNLEHNNVNLALNIINEEINKKHNTRITFGSRQERALDSFDNFPSVLRGLAELSRFFQTRTNAKAFSVKIRRQNTLFRQPTFIQDFSDDDSDSDDSDSGAIYIDYMNEEEIVEAADLQGAIKELINHNKKFISDILENLLNNFQEKMPPNVLTRVLFPLMKVRQLLALHLQLEAELEKVRVSDVELGGVFVSLQHRYLLFCTLTARTEAMREFLADQMANNDQLRFGSRTLSNHRFLNKTFRELVERLQSEATVNFVRKHMYVWKAGHQIISFLLTGNCQK